MNPSDSDTGDSSSLPTAFGGSGTQMRTRSAIGQLPVMTLSSPPASPDTMADRIARLESMMQQLIGAMSTTSSSSSAAIPTVPLPSSATLVALLVINSGDIERKISPKEYRATQSSVTEGVDKCQINAKNSEFHSTYFDDLQRFLNQAHLLKLANGSRKEPKAMITNKYGFTHDQVITIDGEICYIPSDDIGLHHFDRSRLLPLSMKFIGPDLHWHFRADLDSQKCTRIFAALVTYIKGQSAKDVTIAQKHINEWKLTPSNSFSEDAQQLLDFFSKLEFAQKYPTAEDAKMSILLPFLSRDPRPYLLNQYQLIRDKGDKTFNEMMNSLITLSNEFTHHTSGKEKLLSFIEIKKVNNNICFNINKGTCTRGDKCKYAHITDESKKEKKLKIPPRNGKNHHNNPPTTSHAGPINFNHRQHYLELLQQIQEAILFLRKRCIYSLLLI